MLELTPGSNKPLFAYFHQIQGPPKASPATLLPESWAFIKEIEFGQKPPPTIFVVPASRDFSFSWVVDPTTLSNLINWQIILAAMISTIPIQLSGKEIGEVQGYLKQWKTERRNHLLDGYIGENEFPREEEEDA
jgi:hypothetical protein